MVESNFPVSEVRSLIEIPKEIPQIGFLGGDAGNEINDSVRKDYKGINVLQIGRYSGNVVRGSNPFYAVAVQSRLPAGVRVASQADLEKAMKLGVYDFRGTYEDTGLVLRSENEPNSYLAGNLTAQVKERLGKKAKFSGPIMIPLYGLELTRDQDSPKGLAFKLKEDAELISASILTGKNNQKSFSEIDDVTGLPKKLGEGNRRLYTRDSGLSRLYLGGSLGLGSGDGDLAGSDDSGRVVLVSTAEGGSQKFSEYVLQLEAEKERQYTKINGKFDEAMKVLKS